MNLTVLTFATAALCTCYRLIPMIIARKVNIPLSVRIILQHVPVAIFAIMIALDVLFWNSQFNLNPFVNLKLIAAVVSVICALMTKDMLLTMIVGTGTLALLMVLV
ncbi:MAG: AzlD domain-containing protein [Aerococcus sp.]|nr:AzlD domain-containing protein [Aerococcus sp.]